MNRQLATILALFAALAAATPLGAQSREQELLRRHFDRSLADVGKEARRALPGLLLYPEEVRHAILAIAPHPRLVVRVDDRVRDDEVVADDFAEGYPDDARDAAVVLAEHADVLGTLADNLVMTSVVGRVYADDPRFITRTVDRMAQQAVDEHEAAVAAWAKMLEEDETAFEELRRAASEYAEEAGEPMPSEDELAAIGEQYGGDDWDDAYWDDNGWYGWYGYWWWPRGTIIRDVPCSDFVEWLLDRSENFPHIGDRVIQHARERRAARTDGLDFPGDIGMGLDRWQERHPETTMQGFMNDDGFRADRLRELGAARREMRAAGGESRGGVMEHVAQHSDRFQHLGRAAGADRTLGDRPAGATRETTGRPGARATVPTRQPTTNRSFRTVTPTSRQQMQRAVYRHQAAWRPRGSRPVAARRPARGGMRRR